MTKYLIFINTSLINNIWTLDKYKNQQWYKAKNYFFKLQAIKCQDYTPCFVFSFKDYKPCFISLLSLTIIVRTIAFIVIIYEGGKKIQTHPLELWAKIKLIVSSQTQETNI